ncbi:Piso0_002385 [Millerozyma farinosa CBS 7064]|uniref:Piso0_002385 protein n=1 Tax=Pichia sorbitophila (strain ATCC MYA-4447 / BCRC 22081 / CBS 7064 / NBRC 10061 / NRRL Y-12695) TaxID=559304 RepID=G8YCG9_PICSO|nr:Piso0_002385 [Millerozyma farinosa CBS 7064]
MRFEVTFLGVTGGPVEGNTCSMLLKGDYISYQDIIRDKKDTELMCVDAGAGLGSLSDIIYNEAYGNEARSREQRIYGNMVKPSHFLQAEISHPFKQLSKHNTPYRQALEVFQVLNYYFITHPHLDHIGGLVINSAAFSHTPCKKVYGSSYTIEILQKHIFNGHVWPNMPRFDVLQLIPSDFWHTFPINTVYSCTILDLSHGRVLRSNSSCDMAKARQRGDDHADKGKNHNLEDYISSAFLITHEPSASSLLIFGDFESDTISCTDKNKKIWHFIAPLICRPNRTLNGIILECAAHKVQNTNKLYGHMNPELLIQELLHLQQECYTIIAQHDNVGNYSPLQGLNIVINHIKESPDGDYDPRYAILDELNLLNEKHKLGIVFSVAISGFSIVL